MLTRRRRATPEELAEGERQMLAAQQRLQEEQQELPLTNGPAEVVPPSETLELSPQEHGNFEVALTEPQRSTGQTPNVNTPSQVESRQDQVIPHSAQSEVLQRSPMEVEVTPSRTPAASEGPRPSATAAGRGKGSGERGTPGEVEVSTPARNTTPRSETGLLQFSTPNQEIRVHGSQTEEQPLFNSDQLRRLEELQQMSPLLYPGSSKELNPSGEAVRPTWMEAEQQLRARIRQDQERTQEQMLRFQMEEERLKDERLRYQAEQDRLRQDREFIQKEKDRLREESQARTIHYQKEMSDMVNRMKSLEEENTVLRNSAKKASRPPSTYGTPESFGVKPQEPDFDTKEDGTRVRQEKQRVIVEAQERLLAEMERRRGQERPEDGCPSREGHRQERFEDGCPSREGHRQGREEDGCPSREGHRQGAEEDGCPSREGHRQDPREDGRESQQGPRAAGFANDRSMELMLLMMQTMTEMQKKMVEGHDEAGVVKGVEVVRNGVPDLPPLPVWHPNQGPLQLGDWLLMIGPLVADLTTTSEVWWEKITSAAEEWYQMHMALSPLERLKHEAIPPEEVINVRWQRLERRMSSMLLQAVPDGVREELIASRRLSVFGVLTHLLLIYCPGGVLEKQTLLKNLEDPGEAPNVTEAPAAIRKWMRWKKRAQEIGAITPDPALLLKGLNKLTKKVLESHKEVQFRISLTRSSLGVDTTPTPLNVEQLAMHLLAELEQVALTEKRTHGSSSKGENKMKSMETDKEKEKGKGREKGEERPRQRCKFFNTDDGCRKGKSCGWVHVVEGDRKRCWTCGSISHMSPACDRPKEASKEGAGEKGAKGEGKAPWKPSGKAMQKDEGPTKEEVPSSAQSDVSEPPADTMKELLEEAHRMLKGLSVKANEDVDQNREDRLTAMQNQLNELRKMKVLRLSRIARQETRFGLLDSGATHAMRPRQHKEDIEKYEEVSVTLADGHQATMRMTEKGVMVIDDPTVEPIVPMGVLAGKLGYRIEWKDGQMKLTNAKGTNVKVYMSAGCPQVARRVALQMIKEIEDGQVIGQKKFEVLTKEEDWLKQLMEVHPVLKGLPDHLKKGLVVKPAEDLKGIPGCNRRHQKIMEKEGFVAHLYAGSSEGYPLKRALKEVGGDTRRLIEIDIVRENEKATQGCHDMLSEKGPYASLMRGAMNGTLKGVLMGPNCRTRSVLRHYPLDIPGGGPRPVRSWLEPWGLARNTSEEQTKVEEDDLLMWRGIMLYLVGEEVRKAVGRKDDQKMRLGLEQPADPTHYMEDVVTFWKTKEWELLKRMYHLQEQTFKQSAWGGKAPKPTTFAGNIRLRLPEEREVQEGGKEAVGSSKELARWAPGMMREVAFQVQKEVLKGEVRLCAMSWQEHIQRGHTPFRRDCQVCQEASARGRRHLKIPHPRAGILNLDVSGPYVKGNDLEGDAKFMLIGSYTWLCSPDQEDEQEERLPEGPALEEGEEGPQIEEEAEEGRQEDEEVEEDLEEEGREGDVRPGGVEEPPEGVPPPKIEVLKVGVPIKGKTKDAVLEGTIDLILQLRAEGFPIHTVHTDRGREFVNKKFKSWLRCRGITHSTNGGEDPRANGRVERAVGEIKRMVRRLLHGSGLDPKWWPLGLRYLMESLRMRRKDPKVKIPAFGEKLLIKKRNWRTKVFQPTHEEARYMTPSIESHGHCVLKADGRWGIAPYVVRHVAQPPPATEEMWLAIAQEEEKDEAEERRRIRRKGPIRGGDLLASSSLRKMLKEEAASLECDELTNALLTFQKLEPWKKQMRKLEAEDQEILQTKIVSQQEMMAEVDLWRDAIDSEMKSLFQQKQALRKVGKKEKEEYEKKGLLLSAVPSKLVITRKAGGRRKIRIVACGNYVEKDPEEEVYAGGSDSISMRYVVQWAVINQKTGAVLDIKTAFLNAPLTTLTVTEEDAPPVLIRPPAILTRLGFTAGDELWIAEKAIYGLRQSPRAWSRFRDEVMKGMSWKMKERTMVLEPLDTDPNVWRIVAQQDELQGQTEGLVLVYVDDMAVFGNEELVAAYISRIKAEWETSEPEWLSEHTSVKFLGMELWKVKEGILMNQESYIKDLLKRNHEETGIQSGVPVTREQSQRLEEDDPGKELHEVRSAQKVTGELLWLVTRTRPDLMYVLSRMTQANLRNPKEVVAVSKQVFKYLRKTWKEGIWFGKKGDKVLEVYSDSSYGPGGMESQGTVVVFWGGSPIMWKSGKQSVPALSTAESELGEAVEGMVMGDSVDVLIQEVEEKPYGKVIKVDNVAAVNLLTEASGNWRTRHLRLRASHLRWRLERTDWITETVPGKEQTADIGTKVMSAPRLQELKEKLRMKDREEKTILKESDHQVLQPQENGNQIPEEELKMVLKMLVILGSIQQVQAQDEDEEPKEGTRDLWHLMFLVVFASVGVMVTLKTIWTYLQKIFQSYRGDARLASWRGGMHPRRISTQGGDACPKNEKKGSAHPPEINSQMTGSSSSSSRAPLPSSTQSQGNAPLPKAQAGKKSRRKVIITTWGKRWHMFTLCPTLTSSQKTECTWCEHCSSEEREGDRPVYSQGPGSVAHYDEKCLHQGNQSKMYHKCQICMEMIAEKKRK